MKNLLASIVFVFSAFSAQAASLTFNEIYIQKDTTNSYGAYYKTNRSLKAWCTGLGSAISFGTFEAAEKIEKFENGFFRCEGQFVQIPGDRQNAAQIFKIGECSELNPAELKNECALIK